jgi:hypothetical protein
MISGEVAALELHVPAHVEHGRRAGIQAFADVFGTDALQ